MFMLRQRPVNLTIRRSPSYYYKTHETGYAPPPTRELNIQNEMNQLRCMARQLYGAGDNNLRFVLSYAAITELRNSILEMSPQKPQPTSITMFGVQVIMDPRLNDTVIILEISTGKES